MRINLTKMIMAFGVLLMVSCDKHDCTNNNPVFESALPESGTYKAELAKILQRQVQPPNYYFDKLEDNDSVRLLYVDIIGDSLCATAVLTVKKRDEKLDGIITVNGKGYTGAELQDLKFDIVQDSLKTEFIYESFSRIVD